MPPSAILGPVDFLVIEFPNGRLSADGLDVLFNLVEDDSVRVLDLELFTHRPDGSLVVADGADLGTDARLQNLAGASSGILDDADLALLAREIPPTSACGVVVFENSWTASLAEDLAAAGARLAAVGYVNPDDLEQSLA